MLGKVVDFFKGTDSLEVDSSGNPTEDDLLIATGVLLLEMAGVDADYAPEEVKTIFRVMQEQFSIGQGEVMTLLQQAEQLRGEHQKIDQFVATVNANFNVKQRQRILSMIWQVVAADGKVAKHEERLATQMKFRLQLTDQEAEEAKQAGLGRV